MSPISNISRRNFLQVGGVQLGALSALGIGLDKVLAAEKASKNLLGNNVPQKNINVIFMFLQGGASQLDLYDMKPNTSAEIRGQYNPISTKLAGVQLSEKLPYLSQCADKFSMIRSMQSYSSKHGEGDVHIMCGTPTDNNFQHPGIGSVLSWQQKQEAAVPPFIHFGDMKHRAYNAPGYGGILGRKYDPYLIDQDPNSSSFSIKEFDVAKDISKIRMSDRKSLLHALDNYQREHEKQLEFATEHDEFYEQAFALSTSQSAKNAFDISQEPDSLRDLYGRNKVGQSMLMARRLVEAGVRFVTVQGYVDTRIYGWDHHWGIFPHLDQQLPIYDQSYAALLNDLDSRGMLEDTLVITAGEFGRTPKLNSNKKGPGRDHWGKCFTVTLGGGGIKLGQVYGASDKIAGEPIENPVSVPDFVATVYHVLGLDPNAVATDAGRSARVLPEGKVVMDLF